VHIKSISTYTNIYNI